MTTIPANTRLMEGYVAEGVGVSTGERFPCCGIAGGMVNIGEFSAGVPASLMLLDLSHPIAFSHVLRLVAEAVGLDARGGVVLCHDEGDWFIQCDRRRHWCFTDDEEGWTHVPNLPASPDAYPEALAAIAAVVLEEGR